MSSRIKRLAKRVMFLTGSGDEAKQIQQRAAWRASAELYYDTYMGFTQAEEETLRKALDVEKDTADRSATVDEQKLLHEAEVIWARKRQPFVPREEYVRKSVRAEEIRNFLRPFTEREHAELIELNDWLWDVEIGRRDACERCGRTNWDLAPGEARIKSVQVSQPYNTCMPLCEACRKKAT